MSIRIISETLFEKALKGDPESWKTLSGAASDNLVARAALNILENSSIKPLIEPELPDVEDNFLLKLPIIRQFEELRKAVAELKP